MQDYFNDLYKSIRDNIEDVYGDDVMMSDEELEEEREERYYNSYISNFIVHQVNVVKAEVFELLERFGRKVRDVEDVADDLSAFDMVQTQSIPEVPESALDLDELLEKAFSECEEDVKAENALKNEMTYFIEALDDEGVFFELDGFNQAGLKTLEKTRKAIIAFYEENMKVKPCDVSEK